MSTFYFTFCWRDENGAEHIAQYSGYKTRKEAAKDRAAQKAFNSKDKRSSKKYYNFSPITEVNLF